MKDKTYVCGYKYCLHKGEPVQGSESVIVGKKHYHWDCAIQKQEIKSCVELYIDCIGDKTQYPTATRIINNLVYKDEVPIDFIKKNLTHHSSYYINKPVYVLYGLRGLFWEKTFKV